MPSQHPEYSTSFFFRFTWLLMATLGAAGSAFGDLPELCSEAQELVASSTLRRHTGDPGCFRVDLPSAGTLMLDVSVPGSPLAEPRLAWLGAGADQVRREKGRGGHGQVLLRQTPRGLTLATERPGVFFVLVAAEDPALPVAGYKLRSSFIARLAEKDVDEGDEDGSDIAVPPDPSPSLPAGWAADFCRRSEQPGIEPSDDHADTPPCATPLRVGDSLPGVIANAAGDDEDFFTFVVDRLRGLRIDATAGHLTLYDGQGQRLASSAETATTPSLVRVLSPGRYVLRVQGLWGSGEAYEVSLRRAAIPD